MMKKHLRRIDEVANRIVNNNSFVYFIFLLPVFTFGFHHVIYAQSAQSNYDFIEYVSNNQIISAILISVIIAVITALTKAILNMKKQLDTIDIVAKAEIELRKELEKTQKESKEALEKEVKELRAEICELRDKIDEAKKEFNNMLLSYLFDRDRHHGGERNNNTI